MLQFYLKFILTNIVFSSIIASVLIKYDRKRSGGQYPALEIVLYCLGLGPVVTVLLLYYALLLVPGQRDWFYLAVVFLFYAAIAVLMLLYLNHEGHEGHEGTLRVQSIARPNVFLYIKQYLKSKKVHAPRVRRGLLVYWGIVLMLLVVFFWVYNGLVKHNRMEGHDVLIYGNFGKMYYYQKTIPYAKVMLPAPSGFMFQGSPKPAFSLLLTWEFLLNSKAVNRGIYFDTYFRSISGYFGLLILAVVFLWLYRRNRYLALLGVLVLLAGLRFYITILDHHLDSFRIFFLLVSWIWLAYAIKKKDSFSFFMLCLFSGFAAFAHLIGLVIVLINGSAYLLFSEETLKKRIIKSAVFLVSIILLGGVHYILEAAFGSVSGFLNYII
jgi:hypothetical protein